MMLGILSLEPSPQFIYDGFLPILHGKPTNQWLCDDAEPAFMDGNVICVIDHGSFRTFRERQFFVAGSSKLRAFIVRNEPLSGENLGFHFHRKPLAERFDGRFYFQIIFSMPYDVYRFRNFRKILRPFFKVSYHGKHLRERSLDKPFGMESDVFHAKMMPKISGGFALAYCTVTVVLSVGYAVL